MSIDTSKIRTYSQVLGNTDGSGNGMRDFIHALTAAKDGIDGTTIDTQDHEFSTQSYLEPFSNEQANAYFYDDFLMRAVSPIALLEVDNDSNYKANLASSLSMTVNDVQSLIDTVFNYHADNVEVKRKSSTQATCQLQAFRRTSIPTSDILIGAGTIVSTTATSITPSISYTTVSPVTMKASLGSSYFNPRSGFYEILVPVIAVNTGASGNQIASAINVLVTNITGISSTYNYSAASGGLDKETNTQLLAEIIAGSQNDNLSTDQGFFKTVFGIQNVSDTAPIGSGNVLMTRDNGNGGAVDVYVQSNNNQLISIQDELHVYSTLIVDYMMNHQPVEANLTLYPITVDCFNAGGTNIGTLTLTTHFTFVKDRGSFQWSSKATDMIVLTVAGQSFIAGLGSGPVTSIGLSYVYDSLISQIQLLFDSDDGHDLTNSVLVRKAKYTVFNTTIQANLLLGFTIPSVAASMTTILQEEFSISNRLLGIGGIRAEMILAIQSQASTVGITQIMTTDAAMTFGLVEGNDDPSFTSAVIDSNLNISVNEAEFIQLGTVTVQSV